MSASVLWDVEEGGRESKERGREGREIVKMRNEQPSIVYSIDEDDGADWGSESVLFPNQSALCKRVTYG